MTSDRRLLEPARRNSHLRVSPDPTSYGESVDSRSGRIDIWWQRVTPDAETSVTSVSSVTIQLPEDSGGRAGTGVYVDAVSACVSRRVAVRPFAVVDHDSNVTDVTDVTGVTISRRWARCSARARVSPLLPPEPCCEEAA